MQFVTILVVFALVSVVAGGLWGSSEEVPKNLNPNDPTDYGVDVSFPIHNRLSKKTYFGGKYHKMIKGCYEKFSKRECDANEEARLEMNRDQPRTQHNYTELGFKKLRVPKDAWDALIQFYNNYKEQETLEQWPRGNTYCNTWESPTYMISFENNRLRGGIDVKQKIWNGLKPILEEWTGKKLVETSLYGIRVYKEGAVLATHVDRLPLVSSCIIQVDQDVDEPWPIEVYSHDGKAHNVTMKPGDAVLYESHTVLHGRPFPLKGRRYANIFVHFAPIDHDQENEKDARLREETKKHPLTSSMVISLNKQMKDTLQDRRSRGGHEQDNHDEEVVRRHMEKMNEVHEEHGEDAEGPQPREEEQEESHEEERGGEEEAQDQGEELQGNSNPEGRTALHVAAANGDVKEIEKLLGFHGSDLIHAKDENEWQAIHEAARGGHLDALKYLIDMGADIGAQTNNGGTVLWWARRTLEDGHHVIRFLEDIGAPEGSEL